jgi:hypothetical protein
MVERSHAWSLDLPALNSPTVLVTLSPGKGAEMPFTKKELLQVLIGFIGLVTYLYAGLWIALMIAPLFE